MNCEFSIVMEFENALTHDATEAQPVFAALSRQFDSRDGSPTVARGELILVFDPSVQMPADIEPLIAASAPILREHLEIRFLPGPGLRYYEMKNAGAAIAAGEVIIFLDSDNIPEDGWLAAILAPFAESEMIAVNGHTYLGHHDFVSRVLALTWIFPLRDDDEREVRRRALNANNAAFRRSWFLNHPFPQHPGFKVACSILDEQIRRQQGDLVRAPALTRHAPLQGWRFLLWRAAVAGRDDDARYATMRSASRSHRIRRASTRWLKQLLRSARRIVTRRNKVDMPGLEVLPAVLAAWLFYTIAFAAQLVSATTGPRSAPETIPDFVLHS